MKNSGAIVLFTCLVLVTGWWNWPDWGRREFWFHDDPPRIATSAGCLQGQLTTLRSHDGGSLSYVALNEVTALTIFPNPMELVDSGQVTEIETDDLGKKMKQFYALIEQGLIVRVPEKKLVRYLRPSESAHWVAEVEVFRRGEGPLRGFVKRLDVGCWKFD